mmetsp:Transcript_20953/g.20038  ORF Transcript_20953/g.20038 Transcript_20953/m.20038 type:complete len:89 (-) Transcript_20953:823-1089(-)
MHLIKELFIRKITEVVHRIVPQCEVKVYGSHATQLCLHWSDIDLVIIPTQAQCDPINQYGQKPILSRIARELINEIQNQWISHVNNIS